MPPEPKEESAESVSKLRIRTPSGEFFERRFLANSKLQVVFDFVASKGYPWEEFKLLGTFPRRDVSILIVFSSLPPFVVHIMVVPILMVVNTPST